MIRLLIILIPFLFLSSCEDSDSFFGPPNDIKDNIFDHINHYRLMNGLSVLEENNALNILALNHTQYMVVNETVSHHEESTRSTYALEELSMSKYAEFVEGGDLYGRDLVEKWSNNNSSVAIILGDYNFVGIAVSEGGNQLYATIIFTK